MPERIEAHQAPRCNIGPAEIRRRRAFAIAVSALTLVLAAALLSGAVPHLARLAIWPFATAAAVSWLQVANRFCVRFGIGGLQNLGAIGEEQPVERRLLAADQRRAWQLIGQGILIGLLVAIALVDLPI